MLQWSALAFQSSGPEFDSRIRQLFFLFLFDPFLVKNIHVLISGLEPIRTRFLFGLHKVYSHIIASLDLFICPRELSTCHMV